ncbi:MAG: hypothetical protein IPI45_06005 [Saprospiraceae bacterium]|nr:hypothetical protein [Saprospiraceae bacterium]MBK7737314.1 hypothetical protein [Saprospiraceae bacterium]MBK7914092.1 hypothetical protein [Saprospiraceae bacterium]
MKIIRIIIGFCALTFCAYSQTNVSIDGKKYYIKTTENISRDFKLFSICQDQKLSKNCTEYYSYLEGNYKKLPITKTQLTNTLKSTNFNTIKGIKKLSIANGTVCYFQNPTGNTYIAVDEMDNLVLYPVSPSNDVIALGRKAGQSSVSIEQKCEKACPLVLPPGCQPFINGKYTDCFLRKFEDQERCILKCKGKIRMTSIAPFEGIVINTKAN